MVAWSSLVAARTLGAQCRIFGKLPKLNNISGIAPIQVRTCKHTHGSFNYAPSSFSWNKFKDMAGFYLLLGMIPALCIVFYADVFIGPAELKPIPEGYQPKHWEYHAHPISRFLARYVLENPQKQYEKMCFLMFHQHEINLVREIERRVKYLIQNRRDYQSWYYSPAMTRYVRKRAQHREDMAIKDQFPPDSVFPLRI